LIGVRFKRDKQGRIAGLELISREDLGRPRVDVIMHELAHGMGFSADSWALWRYGDAARTPRTPRNAKFPFVPAASYRVDYVCGGEAYWDYLPAGNTLSYFAERGMGAYNSMIQRQEREVGCALIKHQWWSGAELMDQMIVNRALHPARDLLPTLLFLLNSLEVSTYILVGRCICACLVVYLYSHT
jgi:hypothetical protein